MLEFCSRILYHTYSGGTALRSIFGGLFMTIYFGEIFKKLRRERELTQEQAAEAFCVSPQAVSRWECGSTYPDIALLPTIADYFGVTIEELLGTDCARKQARISEYKAKFQNAVTHGFLEDCIEIARAAVKDFPNDYSLQNMLMYALFVSGDDTGNIPNWQENNEKYKQEIIDIGERILKNCTDDSIRLEVKSRLGFHFCEIGDLARGREIFESLPSEDHAKEMMLYWAVRGEERERHLRDRTAYYCSRLSWNIWRYVRNTDAAPEEKLRWLDLCESITRLIFSDDKDFAVKCGVFARFYIEDKIPLYLELGDTESALASIETAARYLRTDSSLIPKT